AQRGRVDVTVARGIVAARRRYTVHVRTELARAYVEAARQLARALGLQSDVGLAEVLRLPDLFETIERPPELHGELGALRRALRQALRAFDAERRREGAHLQRDMQRRTMAIRSAATGIRRRLPAALTELRRQVEERLVRLLGATDIDRGRVAQEVAVLAD